MDKRIILFFSISLLGINILVSCGDRNKKDFQLLIEQWEGKEILFPRTNIFVTQMKDRVSFSTDAKYKILSYVDTIGCISCKLQLSHWKRLVEEVDSLGYSVKFLFYFSPEKEADVYRALRTDRFDYPVCIDVKDSLNKLNHFSSDMMFQTFLLDKRNKVIAIGNPIHNPKIKDLYLSIIQGKKESTNNKELQTTVKIEPIFQSMGTFDWQEQQHAVFTLKNTGDKLLVVEGVTTSCGCTTVEYSSEPLLPGKEKSLIVVYQAEQPGYFEKTITVYCNTKDSPITLKISGTAE